MNPATNRDRADGTVDLFANSGPIKEIGDGFQGALPDSFVPVSRWSSPKAEFFLFEEEPHGQRFVVKAAPTGPPATGIGLQGTPAPGKVVGELDVTVPGRSGGWPSSVGRDGSVAGSTLQPGHSRRSHRRGPTAFRILDLVRKCGQVRRPTTPRNRRGRTGGGNCDSDRLAAQRRSEGLVSPKLAVGRATSLWRPRLSVFRQRFPVSGNGLIVVDLLIREVRHRPRISLPSPSRCKGVALSAPNGRCRSGRYDQGRVRPRMWKRRARPDGNVDSWALYFYELSRISG